MSTLLLIRHGQARAYDPDSDRLSDLGRRQAEELGAYLAQRAIQVDQVVTGTLKRQSETEEIVRRAVAPSGWPQVQTDERWNEYDAPGLLGRLLPELAQRDPEFRALVDAFQEAAPRPDRNRHFQRMFERLTDAWERGEVSASGAEPFADFHCRVSEAFEAITRDGGRRTVAVFTSGGPIGVCVQKALDAPRRTALRLNWRVKNASLTEFVFSKGRLSLEYFNHVFYLDSRDQTFR